MTTHKTYILIDIENVQPGDFEELEQSGLSFKVFLGASKAGRFMEPVADSEKNVEYIRMDGTGREAVDFHVAFYIGKLSELEPEASFRIISKDEGLDPLIHHMNQLGVDVSRIPRFASEPSPSGAPEPAAGAKMGSVLWNLGKTGGNRPKTLKKLKKAIAFWLRDPHPVGHEIHMVLQPLRAK